jgi:mannosyl-oligosaccharide alpha-1,2-mannosidase
MLRRYLRIAKDIKEKLVFKTQHRELYGIGQIWRGELYPLMEHLALFTGGMFAVGGVKGNPNATEDVRLGADLARTCATIYSESKSGVPPEDIFFNFGNISWPDDYEPGYSKQYILRPEAVESVYTMWKFTGLQKYRDWAWEMFLGINRSCRVHEGFASIVDATLEKPEHKDEMESFFLAETMKYLYLIFSDSDIISPAEWVLTTEAHPVRIWDAETIKKFKRLLQFPELTRERPAEDSSPTVSV